MASSSTSSVQKCFKYDVFLSFRGADTRNKFVGHLYNALQHKSIHTYKDDERIKKGERISDELIKSIEDSKFYIIVFSKNYASSSWCLDELVKIMECQNMTGHTAYPVFYDVEPTEVRKQSGEFGNAFAKHEKEEAAGKWTEAMKEAADLAGWELKKTADGDEAKFIQKIVEEISLELRCINFDVDENLVGMETRIKDVISSLEMGSDDVRMVGIKGMGGAGKTTLARAVFDHISIEFEGSSFVEKVRENSNPSLSGLKKLQEHILTDVSNDTSINIRSVHDGKKMMKKRMCCIKVLIVLDDVDHIDQLKALAGECSWFKTGSRIIITTRDEQPLVAHRVNSILYPSLLSNTEALCLFSRYAFGKEIPIQGYEELSEKVVLYAAGLPLALTVLGSFLCGKNELEWENAIERLATIPSMETFDVLEISYNGLEEEHKEIFLDVACMFKGYGKDDAIKALESCGFYATIGLKVLEQKSLITISKYGRLDMHDRIEEMGQYIVRKDKEPSKHSRLWITEEIEDVLRRDQGTKATTCIDLINPQINPETIMTGLGKMKKLRYFNVTCNVFSECLDLSDWELDEVSQYFSNSLQYIKWDGYPFRFLPKTFQASNLVGLYLRDTRMEQLWEGGERKVLDKLRFLHLRNSNLRTFDFGLTPNLEKLTLWPCDYLEELHIPVKCPKLKSIDISNLKLTTLDLRGTPNLEKLDLIECVDLVALHIAGECLNLKSINIYNSKLTTLDLRGTPNLEDLDLNKCVDLVALHVPGECLELKSITIYRSKLTTLDLRGTPNLVQLALAECVDLVELHVPGECLELKSITIYRSKLTTLDLRGTPNLEELDLNKCVDLVALHVPGECLELKSITIYRSKLTTLDLRGTPNLEELDLNKCVDLVALHVPGECLELKSITIYRSKLTTLDLRGTPNLKELILEECVDLVALHIAGECLKLKSIKINNSKLTTLDLRGTPNLEDLDLNKCVDLVALHVPGECLELKSITIYRSKLTTLDLRGTPNLKELILEECVDLVALHIAGECLNLKSINIYNSKLTTLDLRGTPNLEDLDLKKCVDLVALHVPGECLELKSITIYRSKLTTLDLRGTPNLKELILEECVDLVALHIAGECLKLKSIKINNSKLTTLDLRGTPNLKKLCLWYCDDLVALQIAGECLKLESININNSKLTTLDLRGTPNLEELYLNECVDLVALHIAGECLKLKSININNSKLTTLDLRGTPNLEELDLFSGEHLKLESIKINSSKLRTLDLRGTPNLKTLFLTKVTHLPESVCFLKHLKSLELNPCSLLEKLPEDLGRLECLEKLILSDCVFLQDIPDSICEMKCLRIFHLRYCVAIQKLPEDLGRLECLKELNIEGTSIRHLPQSIFELKGLRIVGFRWLLQSCGFTSEIQISEDETFCYVEL